ncbi:methyltransferase domain-containing protein [Neisseriaceae bacterium TC5R-5]|nr:methyltransferase domain-containing protein [Neisseriaceae bacterium TC5R-5]
MKKCLACGTLFPSTETGCLSCSWKPEMQDGFIAYAPAFAQEGGGFKTSYFAELAPLEAAYFWFRARNRLIIWALGKYARGLQSFLEIGCGTGYVLSGLAGNFSGVRFHGSEIFTAGLAFAAARQPAIDFMQMDARDIPFVDEFDAIGAFDVLEHIEEDVQVLHQMYAALKPGGIMLLTVPQHAWLWSPVDEYACHVRRYSARELHAKVAGAGFDILRSTSFVSSLLPAMWASRFIKKGSVQDFDATAELRIAPWLNALFFKMLSAELALIKRSFDFSAGGSRLVVARKV